MWALLCVLGCSNPRDADERACAGYGCTAGQCIASADGSPTCLCSNLDRQAGLPCELLDRNDEADAGVFLEVDAGPTEQTLQARLEGADVDWFRFDAAPRVWYRVQASSGEVGPLALSGRSFVPDPSLPERLYFRSETADVAAFSITSPSGALGRYQVELSAVAADPETGDPARAPGLTFDAGITGSLSAPPDQDAYAFPARTGRVYQIDCATSDGGTCPLNLQSIPPSRYETSDGHRAFVVAASDFTKTFTIGPTWTGERSAYALTVSDWGADPDEPYVTPPLIPTDGGVVALPNMIPGYRFPYTYTTVPGDAYWASATGDAGCQTVPEVQFGGDAGTVRVEVISDGGGSCALQVVDVGPDDFPPGVLTTVAEGETPFVTQFPGDKESFVVVMEANVHYGVTCDPGCTVQHEAWNVGWPGTFSTLDGGFGFFSPSKAAVNFEATGTIGPHLLSIVGYPAGP